MQDWNGVCHRCGEETSSHIMSMYNNDLICMSCKKAEAQRSDYKEAQDTEIEAIKQGNYNFPGIGLK